MVKSYKKSYFYIVTNHVGDIEKEEGASALVSPKLYPEGLLAKCYGVEEN